LGRVRYNVVGAVGWTHVAGPAFQVHVRVDRGAPVVRSLSSAADAADLAALGSLLDEHPECAFALFQHHPVQRVLVRGPARVDVHGAQDESFGPTSEDFLLDAPIDWAVSTVRLIACDDSVPLTPPLRVPQREEGQGVDDLPKRDPVQEAAEPERSIVAVGPPPPDAWWLAGVPSHGVLPDLLPALAESSEVVVADRDSSDIQPRRPARWGSLSDTVQPIPVRPEPQGDSYAASTRGAASIVLPGGQRVAVNGSVVIGRAPGEGSSDAGALALRVPDSGRTVSRRHLRLSQRPEGVLVEDLGSRNGTWLYVRGMVPRHLVQGDVTVVNPGECALILLSNEAVVWLDVTQWRVQ